MSKKIKKNAVKPIVWALAEENEFYADLLNEWQNSTKEELISDLVEYATDNAEAYEIHQWSDRVQALRNARLKAKIATLELRLAEETLIRWLDDNDKPSHTYGNYWFPGEDN